MKNCGLCQAPDEKYRTVVENDYAISVVIFNPMNATHQNIIPRRHVTCLDEFFPEEAKGIFDLQYQVQQRLFELCPNYPPVIGIQTGKHATQPHIHWQAYSSGAHLRLLYARAHEVTANVIGAQAIGWMDERTHPIIPNTEKDNPKREENLESFLGETARSLKGTGNIEIDRRRLAEISHELLRYNGYEL